MEINDAIEFMKKRHYGQRRKQGTPYYTHPMAVSNLLKRKGFSEDYQIAGLFHDLLEDTDTTYEEILNLTNFRIANTVRLVTKEKGYNMKDYIKRINNDEMARMVKLADRVHNLSEAIYCSDEFQEKYIKETKMYFISMARGTIFEEDINRALGNLK